MPKISVIIPVYNVECYLHQCLESVVNQSLQEIEILCVNDGSTDGSFEILSSYAQNDPRIIIIDQKNAGLGAARNAAVRKSTGDYLFFLDSDDWVTLDLCQNLYEKALDNNLDILQIGLQNVNDGLDKPLSYCKILSERPVLSGIDYNEGTYEVTSFSCGKLWRRDFFIDNGLLNQEDIYYEDQLTAFKAFIIAERVQIFDECLYFYRIRPGSIVTSHTSLKHMKSSYFITQQMLLMLDEFNLWNTYGFFLRFARMIYRLNFEKDPKLCDASLYNEIEMHIRLCCKRLLSEVNKPFNKKNHVAFMVLKVPYSLWPFFYNISMFLKKILKK